MKKVSPGQRLRIPARDYNAFVDAARYVQDLQHNRRPGAAQVAPADTVKVLNIEEIAIPRFGLIWLVGMETEGLYSAQRPGHPFLEAIGIAAVPVEPGHIGTAWIDGIHPVLCYDVDALSFPCCAISQSYSYFVRAHSGGNLRLLDWYQGDSDAPLVMARLGQG
jgi:hypothetical protein